MNRHYFTLLAVGVICAVSGCTKAPDEKEVASTMESTNGPEDVYRQFMLANLTGDEATIRDLILPHDDSHVLWQGAYPEDVAKLLAEQYRSMEIVRIESESSDDRVLLQSSALPISLAAVKTDGVWKIDASPIIKFRMSAMDTP